MSMRSTATYLIEGEGKGGRTPREAPDSLFSNSIAHILDLLSEGEIEGLVDGDKSIYYNETPLMGPGGEPNFKGMVIDMNHGHEDQPAIPGFDDVRTTVSVAQDLPYNVYKTISFPNDGSVTAVDITMATQNFFMVNKDGDTLGTSVSFVIERSEDGGTFVPIINATIYGKQNGEYNADYRVPITNPAGNTSIRVKRTKPDSTTLKDNDEVKFKTYTRVTEHKLTYPNCAVIGHVIDAEQFGNQIPNRAYHLRGIKVMVPHNYNPITRAYTGSFNGTLVGPVWTNNPAWIFYDLITNKRYGLGQFVNAALIDIPSLYTIAKWCDDPVPDGKGGTEPRWACNVVINERGEAFDLLKEMVTCFRGILFWMGGKLWAQADLPTDPVKIVTNANVIDGMFIYSGESNRKRYSVVNVAWNDPGIFYRRGYEVYEDPDLIREIGWKPVEYGAFGCTSRAQARRLAKAILYAQEYESELVTYRAGFDHLGAAGDGPEGIAPGDIVLIADKERGNAIAGGRIVSVSGATITLDRDVEATGTGTIYVEHQTGAVEWLSCTYNGATVTLTATPTAPIEPNDLFIITENQNDAEPFRVIRISETEPNVFEVAAVRYDEGKFAAIYGETSFAPADIMRSPSAGHVLPPSGLTVTEGFVYSADLHTRTLELSWTASPDPLLDYYVLSYSKDRDNWIRLSPTSSTGAKIESVRAGEYEFRVTAMNRAGRESAAATATHVVGAVPTNEALPPGTVTGLGLTGGGTTFTGRDAVLSWTLTSPTGDYLDAQGISSNTGLSDPMFRDCVVVVKHTNGTVLRTESVIDTFYTYTYEKNYLDNGTVPIRTFIVEVSYRDKYGRVSAPATITVANPAPVFATTPAIYAGIMNFTLAAERPTDPDFAGMKVYASLTSGFTPSGVSLVYSGPDTSTTMQALGTGVHYFRLVPFDVFGDGTSTSQLSATPAALGGQDTTPPGQVTGLTLSSLLSLDTDKGQKVELTATWNTSTADDLNHYQIDVTLSADTTFANAVRFMSANNRFSRDVLANTAYRVRVRAVDHSGNAGAWSSTVTHTTAADTTPPPAPTDLVATASFKNIFLSWTNPIANDLDYVEIYEFPLGLPASATRIATVKALSGGFGRFTRGGLGTGETQHYWLKAVDTSGNASAFSAGVSATTSQAIEADIAAGAISFSKFSSDLSPVEVVGALPSTGNYEGRIVYLTSDKKMYRWIGSGTKAAPVTGTASWSVATDATDITTGTLSAARIAAASISATKLMLVPQGGTINADPTISDTALWFTNGPTVTTDADFAGGRAWVASVTGSAAFSEWVPIDPAQVYRASVALKRMSGSASAYTAVQFADATQTPIAAASAVGWTSTGDYVYFGLVGGVPPTTKTAYTVTFGEGQTAQIPSNARYMRLGGYVNLGGTGTNRMGDVNLRSVIPAELIVDGTIVASKIKSGEISSVHISTSGLAADDIKTGTFSADRINVLASTVSISGAGVTIGGINTNANTANTNATTALTGTAKYRTAGAPTNAPTPTGITITENANGTRNIRVDWGAYTQGANQADFLFLFWRKANSAPTTSDSSLGFNVNTGSASYHIFEGVNPADTFSFGIAAGRRTESGIEIGTIQAPASAPQWVNVATGTPNYTANVGGTAAATVVSNAALGAQNPADRINAPANTTLIEPGKILISGASTLASWRNGSDLTKIEGGSIATNTIAANMIRVGGRGIDIAGLEFEANRATVGGSVVANRVAWSAGTITYINDAGTGFDTHNIVAGSIPNPHTSGTMYIYWDRDSAPTTLQPTTNAAAAYGANRVVIATYRGGVDLVATYGRTIIDGSQITVDTLDANRVKAGTVLASTILVGSGGPTLATVQSNAATGAQDPVTRINSGVTTIDGGKITADSLDANRVKAGTVLASNLVVGAGGPTLSQIQSNAAAGAQAKQNLLDMTGWYVGGPVSGGAFTGGEPAGDSIQSLAGPAGSQEAVWVATEADTNTAYSGAWSDHVFSANFDHRKSYLYSVWVRRPAVLDDGFIYLGASVTGTANLDGTVNANPYFVSELYPPNSLVPDKWYLLVGMMHGSGYSGTTPAGISGVYDPDTGARIIAGTEFKNRVTATSQSHRAFNYLVSTDRSTHFARPAVEEFSSSVIWEWLNRPTGGENLFPDGSFEQGIPPIMGWADGGSVVITHETSGSHHGSRHLRLSTAGGHHWRYTERAIKAVSDKLTVSLWVKDSGVAGHWIWDDAPDVPHPLHVFLTTATTSALPITKAGIGELVVALAAGQGWTKATYTFRGLTPGTNYYIGMMAQAYSGQRRVDIDALKVENGGAATDFNVSSLDDLAARINNDPVNTKIQGAKVDIGGRIILDANQHGTGLGTIRIRNAGDTVNLVELGYTGASTAGMILRNNAGNVIVDHTYNPIESGADVTSAVTGPALIQIECDSAGTPKTGQLPKNQAYRLIRNGVDVSASASWSRTIPAGVTTTIGASSGNFAVTAITSSPVTVRITAAYLGTSRSFDVVVDKVLDPPPSGGGGGGGTGGTSATQSASGAVSTSTQAVISPEIVVNTGSTGTVSLTCSNLKINPENAAPAGSWTVNARFQWWNGSGWVDVGSAGTGTSTTSGEASGDGTFYYSFGGDIPLTTSHANSANQTNQRYRLIGWQSSGGTKNHWVSGSATAQGS
jgi:predicted phage tail protein